MAAAWLAAAIGPATATEKAAVLPIDQQCEAEIAIHHQKLMNDYAKNLGLLAKLFQEKADLDNLLLVKAEQDRFNNEKNLAEKNLAAAPPELRQLQSQCLNLLKSTREQVAHRYFSAADNLKKKHTREGDIPKALAAKADAERLIAKYPFLAAVPEAAKKTDPPAKDPPAKAEPPEPEVKPVASDATVKIDDLYADYVKDPNVANRKYKGRKFIIQGEITSFFSGSGSKDFGVTLKTPGTAWRVECLCAYRGEGVIVIKTDVISVDVVVGKRTSVVMGTTLYGGKSDHKVTDLIWTGETRSFNGECQGVTGGKILFENCTWSDAKK